MLVQGNTLTSWCVFVAKNFDSNENKNTGNAVGKESVLYLESLVGLEIISDEVIFQLCGQKKLTMMPYLTLSIIVTSVCSI